MVIHGWVHLPIASFLNWTTEGKSSKIMQRLSPSVIWGKQLALMRLMSSGIGGGDIFILSTTMDGFRKYREECETGSGQTLRA